MAAAFKALNQAIIDASPIIQACTPYLQASGTLFVRAQPVPANALGYLLVDITPRKVDPNAKPFVPVIETIPFVLVNHKTVGATQAICVQLAATAIEADIAALITARAIQGEVPGPAIRVLLGRTTVLTKPNINNQLSVDWLVIGSSDAGPLGRFA